MNARMLQGADLKGGTTRYERKKAVSVLIVAHHTTVDLYLIGVNVHEVIGLTMARRCWMGICRRVQDSK